MRMNVLHKAQLARGGGIPPGVTAPPTGYMESRMLPSNGYYSMVDQQAALAARSASMHPSATGTYQESRILVELEVLKGLESSPFQLLLPVEVD